MTLILNLTIRRKWLDMIASGEKREEYRRADNSQVARVWRHWFNGISDGAVAVFRAGYTIRSRAVAVEVVNVMIRGAGEIWHPEWGEDRKAARYVLQLGRVLFSGEYADVRAWMEGRT